MNWWNNLVLLIIFDCGKLVVLVGQTFFLKIGGLMLRRMCILHFLR